jgi:hypothetical protein
MALTFTGWKVTVSFIDKGGDITKKTYDVRGADYGEASTNVIALMTDLQAASLAAITGYNLGGEFAQDALALPTLDGARNSIQALITVDIADNPLKHGTITIPAPVSAVFVATSGPNSDIVNATAGVVTDLVDNFKADGTVFISDGEDVDTTAPNIKGIRRTLFRRLA